MMPFNKTAAATGLYSSTVKLFLKEARSTEIGQTSTRETPNKGNAYTSMKSQVNSFDECVVRQLINTF
jgi:hypothetical protein